MKACSTPTEPTMSAEGMAHTRPTGVWAQSWRLAVEDLVEGVRQYELWITLGLQNLRRRYRRSVLGPLWLTLSLAILVTAIGALFGKIMGLQPDRYVPHLALGLIAWQFIQGVIDDGCNAFIANKVWITNVRTPLSLSVFRMVWEHLISMGHNALVYVGVAVIFGINAGTACLLIVPALVLLIANAVWVILLFGILCARFRDIPQIVHSVMRVTYFITPVMWMPESLGDRGYLTFYNPFTLFVELIRAPLMGQTPSALTWGLALAVTVSGWVLAGLVFVRYRARVPFWL